MLSAKRKLLPLGLERRIRPRKGDDDSDLEMEEDVSGSSEDEGSSAGEEYEGSQSEVEESESDGKPPAGTTDLELSSVSFGDLARAQAALPPSQLKDKKESIAKQTSTKAVHPELDSDSEDSEPTAKSSKGRLSKHAPMEISSKRAVPRKREVVAVPKRPHRDPRFDTLSGPLDETRASRAYAFLDDYRASEMADLRARIKREKNAAAREQLQRELMSMESRKKARERKESEKKILEEHRAKEKELVKQGKKPFYLKKSEQKKRLLMDQFAGMKKRQVDRVIERKRKRAAAKDKRELESLQRVRNRD